MVDLFKCEFCGALYARIWHMQNHRAKNHMDEMLAKRREVEPDPFKRFDRRPS